MKQKIYFIGVVLLGFLMYAISVFLFFNIADKNTHKHKQEYSIAE